MLKESKTIFMSIAPHLECNLYTNLGKSFRLLTDRITVEPLEGADTQRALEKDVVHNR